MPLPAVEILRPAPRPDAPHLSSPRPIRAFARRRTRREEVPIGARSARSLRAAAVAFAALCLATTGLLAGPPPAAAAGEKVVVVVGPSGSNTSDYLANARALAATARSYGAEVIELYTPNATWSKVVAAARGAKLLIYLGHGNGWPSPYAPFQEDTKDGLGLNAHDGSGNTTPTYYGANHVRNLDLAPGAVVVLSRLCYASGNSEWGWADPSLAVARERIDNYATGFLAAGASVVIAEAIERPTYVIHGLFGPPKTMAELFWSAPNASGARGFAFDSVRTPGARVLGDPTSANKYWRSIVGNLAYTTWHWIGPVFVGVAIPRSSGAATAADLEAAASHEASESAPEAAAADGAEASVSQPTQSTLALEPEPAPSAAEAAALPGAPVIESAPTPTPEPAPEPAPEPDLEAGAIAAAAASPPTIPIGRGWLTPR